MTAVVAARQRGRSGRVLLSVFAAGLVAAVFALGGFYIGRNVLGEQYLKRAAVTPRMQGAPYVPQTAQPAEPRVIDEPPTVEEHSAPVRRTRRRAEAPAASPAAAPREESAARPRNPAATLQLGSFLDPDNARNLVQDLRNRGYSPRITVQKDGRTTVHKVTIGPLATERARDLATDLRREGYQVGVAGGE